MRRLNGERPTTAVPDREIPAIGDRKPAAALYKKLGCGGKSELCLDIVVFVGKPGRHRANDSLDQFAID